MGFVAGSPAHNLHNPHDETGCNLSEGIAFR